MHGILYKIILFLKIILLLVYNLVPKKCKIKIENFLFFQPRKKRFIPLKDEILRSFHSITLKTSDWKSLKCLFYSGTKQNPAIIFCHGQSENISMWQDAMLLLKALNITCVFMSYRGHYKSNGKPSEQGIYKDAERIIQFLNEKGFCDESIIIWGRSLGSSVACEMALRHNLKAIILESAIKNIKSAALSITDFFCEYLHIKFLKNIIYFLILHCNFIQQFSNDKKIPEIKCPILIMHGKNDIKINSNIAEELHSLNSQSTLYIDENGCHSTNTWCFDEVEKFLRTVTQTRIIVKKQELV